MGVRDIALVEKTIRAFSLLEALARSGCPFIFKGGSSLMLHLNTSKRLSIDIDIICPPGTIIEDYLNQYADEYGFGKVELVERISRTDVPKQHAKFYYEVSYPGNGGQDKILLDVLFEETHYMKVVSLPIQSPLLITEEPLVHVKLPSHEDLLGDKLTAFAPHTTGIPFFKGQKKCTMEIIKQLFDVASLFDITNNLTITRQTFKKFAAVELQYRHLQPDDIQQVYDDIYPYGFELAYLPKSGAERDWLKEKDKIMTLVVNYVGGNKVTYTGVKLLKFTPNELDGKTAKESQLVFSAADRK